MIDCPSCNHSLPADRGPSDPCPSCGKSLALKPSSKSPSSAESNMDTKELASFSKVDASLYSRIKQVSREGSWHLAIMAEILDFQVKRLSRSLNQAVPVLNRMFNLSTHSKRIGTIESLFNEFLRIIGDFHTAFCRDFAIADPPPSADGLWDFYEQTDASIDRLLKFHASVVKLRFVRDSNEHRIQGIMMDWVHHELVCFEELRKQLNRKSNFEPDQLKERSVQVTLAPPNLHTYYELLNIIHTTKEGL